MDSGKKIFGITGDASTASVLTTVLSVCPKFNAAVFFASALSALKFALSEKDLTELKKVRNEEMKRIRKIMVAYDFSDYSKEALEFAVELADELKSDLMIVNVINQREVDAVIRAEMEAVSFSADKFIKDRKKDRMERINEIVEKLSAKHLPVEIKIKTGVPFRELIQAVKDSGVDLVVMGRKGRSNLAGILFGTTAEKMFRHCPVALLSLRENMSR